MLDTSPDGDDVPLPEKPWSRTRCRPTWKCIARASANLIRKPGRALLLSARALREFGEQTRNPALIVAARQWRNSLRGPLGRVLNIGRKRDEERDPPPTLPVSGAPRTRFNRGITPHRKFAFRATSLSQVKAIKNALGATVNDVVMAACAGALRTYLEKRGELPDEPLVAMVPV